MQDDPNLNTNPTSTYAPSDNDDSLVKNINPQISNPIKEAAPFSSEASQSRENYIEVSEKEPQIAPEVESSGVYKVSDKVRLDTQAREAGVTEAKESVPVSVNGQKIILPLSPDQAKIDAKGKPSDSITWIANIVMIYLKKLRRKNAR